MKRFLLLLLVIPSLLSAQFDSRGGAVLGREEGTDLNFFTVLDAVGAGIVASISGNVLTLTVAGAGSATFTVEEDNVSVATDINDLDFGSGFDITASGGEAEISLDFSEVSGHDDFTDFVGNEHIDHTAVTITTGEGLTGGGDISANRTFVVDLSEFTTDVSIASGDLITFRDISPAANNLITFANFEATIDHDALIGFVAGEHIAEGTIDHGSIAGLGDDDHSAYENELDNEAGLYSALSDVSNFLQTGDVLAGDDITDGSIDGSEIDESSLVMTGLIDDDDLAAGAVDGGSGGEIADGTVDANDLDLTDDYALTGGLIFDGPVDIGTQETFDASDATPNVSTGINWISNATTFTITDFDGTPSEGDLLYVESGGATTYDCTSSGLDCGSTDIVTASGDFTVWKYDGTNWDLQSFMDVSTDMGTDATGGTPATADISDVSVTQDELEELETIGATTISANQWIVLGGLGTRTEFIPIGWMDDGAVPPAAIETFTATNNVKLRRFDDAADEDVDFVWQVPVDIVTGSAIKFQVLTIVTEATGPSTEGWVFFLQGASIGSGDILSATLGTAVLSQRINVTDAQNDMGFTVYSAAVTVTNLAAGELALFTLYRDISDANDDYAQDIGVVGINIKYQYDLAAPSF